jgi:hypothetical protein
VIHKRTPTILLIVLLVLAIAVGGTGAALAALGLSQSGEALDKADAIIEARDASRIVACGTANDIAKKHNDLVDGVENTLRVATQGNGNRTPEQQARIEAFLAQQIAQYEAIKVAIRDCSPEGLRLYYHEPKEPK